MPGTVPFDDLPTADLTVESVYLGGTKGHARDDPLARLLPVGNQGGFRYKGSPRKNSVQLAVLYTSGAEIDWPDNLDPRRDARTAASSRSSASMVSKSHTLSVGVWRVPGRHPFCSRPGLARPLTSLPANTDFCKLR
jgi:hypothetical protein